MMGSENGKDGAGEGYENYKDESPETFAKLRVVICLNSIPSYLST